MQEMIDERDIAPVVRPDVGRLLTFRLQMEIDYWGFFFGDSSVLERLIVDGQNIRAQEAAKAAAHHEQLQQERRSTQRFKVSELKRARSEEKQRGAHAKNRTTRAGQSAQHRRESK